MFYVDYITLLNHTFCYDIDFDPYQSHIRIRFCLLQYRFYLPSFLYVALFSMNGREITLVYIEDHYSNFAGASKHCMVGELQIDDENISLVIST